MGVNLHLLGCFILLALGSVLCFGGVLLYRKYFRAASGLLALMGYLLFYENLGGQNLLPRAVISIAILPAFMPSIASFVIFGFYLSLVIYALISNIYFSLIVGFALGYLLRSFRNVLYVLITATVGALINTYPVMAIREYLTIGHIGCKFDSFLLYLTKLVDALYVREFFGFNQDYISDLRALFWIFVISVTVQLKVMKKQDIPLKFKGKFTDDDIEFPIDNKLDPLKDNLDVNTKFKWF